MAAGAGWKRSSKFNSLGGAMWKVRVDKGGSNSGDKPVLQVLLGEREKNLLGTSKIHIVRKLVSAI